MCKRINLKQGEQNGVVKSFVFKLKTVSTK